LDIVNSKAAGKAWIEEATRRSGGDEAKGKGSASSPADAGETGGRKNEKTEKPAGLSLLDKHPRDVSVILPGEAEEKPKKKPKKRSKKNDSSELENLVSALLTTVFSIAASKDPEIWTVSDAEVKSIAEPAGKILKKLDKTGKASAYSDGLMLILALLIVVGSRGVKTVQKKKEGKGGIKIERYEKGKDQNSDGKNSSSSATPPDLNTSLAAALPCVG
jgi:hypothetical protein